MGKNSFNLHVFMQMFRMLLHMFVINDNGFTLIMGWQLYLSKFHSSRVYRALLFSFSSLFKVNTTKEHVNFNYLLKNMSLPSKYIYIGRTYYTNWIFLLKGLDQRHSTLKRKTNPQLK